LPALAQAEFDHSQEEHQEEEERIVFPLGNGGSLEFRPVGEIDGNVAFHPYLVTIRSIDGEERTVFEGKETLLATDLVLDFAIQRNEDSPYHLLPVFTPEGAVAIL